MSPQRAAVPDDPSDQDTCTVFADIEVDGNQLTDFTVNGEDPRSRLTVGGDPVTVNGVTYTPIGGYETITSGGVLFVAYTAKNETAAVLQSNTYSSAYVDSAGQQFAVSAAGGPSQVQPGAQATMVVTFDGPGLGGRLVISDNIDDDNYTSVDASLPIPSAT